MFLDFSPFPFYLKKGFSLFLMVYLQTYVYFVYLNNFYTKTSLLVLVPFYGMRMGRFWRRLREVWNRLLFHFMSYRLLRWGWFWPFRGTFLDLLLLLIRRVLFVWFRVLQHHLGISYHCLGGWSIWGIRLMSFVFFMCTARLIVQLIFSLSFYLILGLLS